MPVIIQFIFVARGGNLLPKKNTVFYNWECKYMLFLKYSNISVKISCKNQSFMHLQALKITHN
jgi:hypothetical protein